MVNDDDDGDDNLKNNYFAENYTTVLKCPVFTLVCIFWCRSSNT
jgi:hypothetical protein